MNLEGKEDLDLSKRKATFSFLVFILTVSFLSATSFIVTDQELKTIASETVSTPVEYLGPNDSMTPSISDSWTYNDYIVGIEGIYDTFNYFNLSKYGGGWQYEVTRDWNDIAFTNGKYIGHDAECMVGLLSAYNLTRNAKYLRYAEDVWNWDLRFFFDDVYGGYYVRLNQDNSIAIGDKGMFEHGWFGLATAQLYRATGNSTYLDQLAYIYTFVTNNFYDISDGSYYGALSRNLAILVSDVDTNWCAPYARFLMAAYIATGNSTYGDKAIELVDNLMNYAYDSQYGWIVNRVSPDWSSFSNPAKGWYDVLQTFIDAYRVFGNSIYLTFAQTCFDDIQQANSTVGYLMEMNRDWTSAVNNELLGEEDPGTAIAYLRIANALQNTTILQEAYRYRDAIYTGLYDPTFGGIYRRIYAGGSQSTWKQWCGAGRVIEMLAEFASHGQIQTASVLVWGDSDPNGQERAGRTIAENLEEIGLNVTFVSDFNELENELLAYNYRSLVLVTMPWSDTYSNIPTSTENLIESLVGDGELGLVGFHDIIWQNANNPVLENIFGGTLTSFTDRDSTYSIVNISHPIVYGLPSSFALDDDQLLRGSWDIGVDIVMEADYLNTPVVVTNEYNNGRSAYIAAGGGSGYSNAIVNNDTNLVQLYRNAVFWSCNISHESDTQLSNKALYFDGSDEVIIPSASSLNPTNALTVMAWIHADDWIGNQRILQKGVDDQYRLLDEGNLEFGLAGVSGGDIGTPLPTTGAWHHVAGTYDGSTITLYVDGVKRVSNSASGPLQTSSTSLYIGNKPLSSYPGDRFKGIIDEVRIYNRALSNQEINDTMINASPVTSGLVLYLSFDALEGSTCPDLSGYENDGVNYGAEIVTSFDWSDFQTHPSCEIDNIGNVPYGVSWTGSVTNGTHIAIFGGENSGGRISSILVYDIEKNISTVIPGQFSSGLARSTSEYWGGSAYIFGGDNGAFLDTIQIYDISSGILTTSNTHLLQPAKEIGSATNGTYIYLFGGFGSSPERKITILGFDPATEEIVNTGATLPEGLSQTTPVFAGDVVYIFGGHRYGGSAHTYILKFDPSTNTCAQITTTMPREISSMSAVWDGDESIFIFGGALDGYSGDTQYDTIYVFNTTSETIVEHPLTLPVPSIFQMAEYVDGCAYIIGGRTGTSTYLDDIVKFNPYLEKPWPSLKVTRSPLIPSQSQLVQVQVTTLSNLAINQSILSHTYDGVTYTNVSMSNTDDQWIGWISPYPSYTQVRYRVYVQNIIGDWAVSELYSYDVIDTEGPVISTTRDPITPIHSQSVTINATVIDASNISQVLLHYSSDNQETWTEVAMGQIGNNWIEIIPLFLAGTNVSYYVQAEDSEGNWGASEISNYTIDDIQGPSIITSREILTPYIGEMVKVTAAVYDTSMVDTVWLSIRLNNGSWKSYWMNKEGYVYTAYIIGQGIGTFVEYRVQANDTVGNWGISQIEAYSVIDHIGPIISLQTELSAQGQNVVVLIEVGVVDPGGVNQVLLCYSLNSGATFTNISMGNVSGTWSASIPMGLVGESVFFSIYAEDQSRNWEISQLYSYQIIDVLAPNVHISITSNQTDTLTVELEMTDDSEILSVLIKYTTDDWGNESELALHFQDGVWVAQLQFNYSSMNLQYRIVAEDTAHNIYESGIMFYTIVHSYNQTSPLDLALVAVTSGGIGVAAILIILYLRRRTG